VSSIAAVRVEPKPSKRWALWSGRVITGLPILAFLASAAMKLAQPPQVVETFSGRLGYPQETLLAIATLELFCVLVYAIPRTAVLGAVLLTGYLGGAIATHVRVGDPFVVPLALGVLVWAGVYFREDRLRHLLPLRTSGPREE
jgi:hypothetical protein